MVRIHNQSISKQLYNQFIFHDNSYKSRIILSLIMIKHIINKKNNQLNYTHIAYTRLEPKSFHNNQVFLTT